MATTDANGFITIENSDLFNISHANGNAAAASAVATRVTTAEGAISDIQTALGTKVDTSTYTAGMATKVNSSTYTSGMATKVDKVDGKGLSTEDYTSAEKTKLAGIAEGANNYNLPKATTSTLGGIKVGDGLSINDGVLSAGVYALPTASSTTKGGVKVGRGLEITNETLSAFGYYTSLEDFVPYIYIDDTLTYVNSRSYAYLIGRGTSTSPALCTLCFFTNQAFSAGSTIRVPLDEIRVAGSAYNYLEGSIYAEHGDIEGHFYFNDNKTIYIKPTVNTTKVHLNATFPAYLT